MWGKKEDLTQVPCHPEEIHGQGCSLAHTSTEFSLCTGSRADVGVHTRGQPRKPGLCSVRRGRKPRSRRTH